MKIIVYCQHVLGVGHFFRTLEIVKALGVHDVILVTGGGTVNAALPVHVRHISLPGLRMDENFKGFFSLDKHRRVDEIRQERRELLLDLITREKPDLFLVELYPFGRKAFRFELDPVLDLIRQDPGFHCRVVCSLRDILVEKKKSDEYESRVVAALNQWFDALLIHSDPACISLDATFSRINEIRIPIRYTGFVTPFPKPAEVSRIRKETGLKPEESLIVVSAGGGNVGADLLKAAAAAQSILDNRMKTRMKIFTGPYMEPGHVDIIKSLASSRVVVESFSNEFVSLLGASDLSISMAGYNTCMNIMAAGVPALVRPFAQNREQRFRARILGDYADMTLLEDDDLHPENLSAIICDRLISSAEIRRQHCADPVGSPEKRPVNLMGAAGTAAWIEENLIQ